MQSVIKALIFVGGPMQMCLTFVPPESVASAACTCRKSHAALLLRERERECVEQEIRERMIKRRERERAAGRGRYHRDRVGIGHSAARPTQQQLCKDFFGHSALFEVSGWVGTCL